MSRVPPKGIMHKLRLDGKDDSLKFKSKYLPDLANKAWKEPTFFNMGLNDWKSVFVTVRGEDKSVHDNDSQRMMTSIIKRSGGVQSR